jgi:hypothetical protein
MPDLREFVFTKYTRKGRVEDRAIGRRRRTELVIPGTPPSFNVTAQAHWTKHRKAKREWQNWLGIALMSAAVPRNLLCVEATASLVFKQNRRRDEGNFRVILEKALGDCLVEGGWLPDDTPDRYTFGRVELRVHLLEAPLTTIDLKYYQREER